MPHTSVTHGKAQSLYDTIIIVFNKHYIDYKINLVGLSLNGANVIFGNSIKSLIECDVSNIFVIKCICHSLALCASYECQKFLMMLKNYLLIFIQIWNTVSIGNVQFCEYETTQPVAPSLTRWLSLHACGIKRYNELYTTIKLYFQSEFLLNQAKHIFFSKLLYPMYGLHKNFLDFFTNL